MHTCPSCGQACYCCGDIEDHDTGDEFDCDHWLECEDDDLIDDEAIALPSAHSPPYSRSDSSSRTSSTGIINPPRSPALLSVPRRYSCGVPCPPQTPDRSSQHCSEAQLELPPQCISTQNFLREKHKFAIMFSSKKQGFHQWQTLIAR